MMLGHKLKWNPDKERFVNDAEADKLLSRPMRAMEDMRGSNRRRRGRLTQAPFFVDY